MCVTNIRVCLDAGSGPAVVMDNRSVLHYLRKERGKLVPQDDTDYSVVCSDISKRSLVVVATTFLMMYKFKLDCPSDLRRANTAA